jgi:hypothetical protein
VVLVVPLVLLVLMYKLVLQEQFLVFHLQAQLFQQVVVFLLYYHLLMLQQEQQDLH